MLMWFFTSLNAWALIRFAIGGLVSDSEHPTLDSGAVAKVVLLLALCPTMY